MSGLLDQVGRVLNDGVLDEHEDRESHDALMSWTGGAGSDGEESIPASLPLDPSARAHAVDRTLPSHTSSARDWWQDWKQRARPPGRTEREMQTRRNWCGAIALAAAIGCA